MIHTNPIHFMRKGARFFSEKTLLQWYPPFLLMGVKVLELPPDWHRARFLLPLKFRARNAGGCMFGGFQASLADPIPALACVRRFPGYSVWTRKLQIDFIREGSTDLELRFDFDPAQEQQIRQELEETGRCNPCFEMSYHLDDGTLCSKIHNTVAIRPKGYRVRPHGPGGSAA